MRIAFEEVLEKVEIEVIRNALRKVNGKKGEAAKILGVSRKTLFNKIKKYKIKI